MNNEDLRIQLVNAQWVEIREGLEAKKETTVLFISMRNSEAEIYPETIMQLEKVGYDVDTLFPGIVRLKKKYYPL